MDRVGTLRNMAIPELQWPPLGFFPSHVAFAWAKELEPYVHPRGIVRVQCVGLFDTVGALGVPLQGFRRLPSTATAAISRRLRIIPAHNMGRTKTALGLCGMLPENWTVASWKILV